MIMKIKITALVLFALATVLKADPPITDPLDVEAIFVSSAEQDLSIVNKAIALLDEASSGSTVRMAIHNITRVDVSRAIINAYQRGVDIKIISRREGRAISHILSEVPEDVVILNDGGAHGPRGNHNKFIIISPLSDEVEYAVFQTTASFTHIQTRQENDAVVIYNDEGLYHAYLQYWDDMARNEWDLGYYKEVDTASGIRLYLFPHYEADGRIGYLDPIAEVLDGLIVDLGREITNITRSGIAAEPYGTPLFNAEDVEIRVAMSIWTNRRAGIAHRLAALHDIGADVKILVDPSSTSSSLLSFLEESQIPLAGIDSLHNKQMLVKYPRQDEGFNHLVFTGTANFTQPALRFRDETIIRVNDESLYDAYLTNWNNIWNDPNTVLQEKE